MNTFFAITEQKIGDDGTPAYYVEPIEAEDLQSAIAEVDSDMAPVVIEAHKFERVISSLTFPVNPVDYQWAYLTHQQTFRCMGHHPDPDEDELKDQAIADYGDGIAQDVIILNAREALMLLTSGVRTWNYYKRKLEE